MALVTTGPFWVGAVPALNNSGGGAFSSLLIDAAAEKIARQI
jgi:hypothetical protein